MILKRYTKVVAASIISLCGFFLLSYVVDRNEFFVYLTVMGVLFVSYFILIREIHKEEMGFNIGLALSVLFRALILFSIPILSDDYFRFIWDGNLLAHGINPFSGTPTQLITTSTDFFLPQSIYDGLNSKEYFTVYPPVSQFIYWLSAMLFGSNILGNVIVMRLFIFAAEIGSILVLRKLLTHYGQNPKYAFIYGLNPLMIIELTGNLHFEGVMIFFLLLAFYLLINKKYTWAFICITLSVNTKLIPLLLTPYLIFSLGIKRTLQFAAIGVFGTIALHLPFLDQQFIENFSSSLGLYFKSFEFNASIYYIVRWVGFQIEGYNIIQTAGPVLALISTSLIVTVSWLYRNKTLKNLPVVYIIILTIYYLFSTTVHPWYVSSLLLFVPLSGILLPVAWSALVTLTYITYLTTAYEQSFLLIGIEYVLVFAVLCIDIYRRKETIAQRFSIFVPSGTKKLIN